MGKQLLLLRKFAAIVFVFLYAVMLFGYQLYFHFIERKASATFLEQLDKGSYRTQDLITITLPLTMPYITDTQEFERVDGEIVIDGKIFHFVKRKIQNGNVVLQCLPDYQKMKIEGAKEDFFRLANDLQKTGDAQKPLKTQTSILKLLTVKYEAPPVLACALAVAIVDNCKGSFSSVLFSTYLQVPDQPPQYL